MRNMDSGNITVVICTLVLGLVVVFLFFRFRSKRKNIRDQILFVGPRSSGKTLLTRKLAYGIEPTTVMSSEVVILDDDRVLTKRTLVDFPGHPKLRHQLAKFVSSALKIVFVFDASNTQSQLRDSAEYMYDLFTNAEVDGCSSMMVVCNKSDVSGARPSARIKLNLEQELEKIKLTRKSLEDGDDDKYTPLGRENQPFLFKQDSPIDVEFIDLSAKTGPLDALQDFIES